MTDNSSNVQPLSTNKVIVLFDQWLRTAQAAFRPWTLNEIWLHTCTDVLREQCCRRLV